MSRGLCNDEIIQSDQMNEIRKSLSTTRFGNQPTMNTLVLHSQFATGAAPARQAATESPYATAAQTAAPLRSGAQYRRERMEAADMITSDEAAELADTSRVTVNAWIKSGRCMGVAHLRRVFKLPRWQSEPTI